MESNREAVFKSKEEDDPLLSPFLHSFIAPLRLPSPLLYACHMLSAKLLRDNLCQESPRGTPGGQRLLSGGVVEGPEIMRMKENFLLGF